MCQCPIKVDSRPPHWNPTTSSTGLLSFIHYYGNLCPIKIKATNIPSFTLLLTLHRFKLINPSEETGRREEPQKISFSTMSSGAARLLVLDFALSFMWLWSGVLVKIFVFGILGFGDDLVSEVVKASFSILNMFFFAFLVKISNGSAYNPLTILSAAFSGDFSRFLFVVGARIPAQVMGAITAVRLIIHTFPEAGRGPRLTVGIHHGALTEGLLTFAIVSISLGLSRKIVGNFFMKTWISSLSKLTLHILGSDLTGGCMNPASVMGWAYARGEHITTEHILVYWIAPIQGTIAAILTFKLLFRQPKEEKVNMKKKSE
ncbi:putative aquaporin SIP2-1 [Cucumis melo var. makuwa]|uniref:Aquaporin SIP2-1 n=2 Tax=Cucumis melo TaxID=3656 RepID=A0A5D3DPA9_CUCMM|nr:putative aquaporin SIP2-1 [Cucumis melo var. makuwa]TYK25486.1 putative aquaporin SIP2-1 [Cucumis melo var. makuwa]